MKLKVFDVCAGLMTISQFEEWFYHDAEIQSSILEDDNVLRLCVIDLSKKYALHDHRKFCFETFDNDEFYVYDIEENAKRIVGEENENWIIQSVRNICEYSSWGDNKHLFYTFYVLQSQYYDYEYIGGTTRREILNEIKLHANLLLEKFENAELQEKKNLVFDGLGRDHLIIQPPRQKLRKRWYQFWK